MKFYIVKLRIKIKTRIFWIKKFILLANSFYLSKNMIFILFPYLLYLIKLINNKNINFSNTKFL